MPGHEEETLGRGLRKAGMPSSVRNKAGSIQESGSAPHWEQTPLGAGHGGILR